MLHAPVKYFFIFLLLFIAVSISFAQIPSGNRPSSTIIETDPSFRLQEAEGGILFLQRLAWEKAQFAVRYMILLERKNEITGVWTEVLRRNVSEEVTNLEVSVPAGQFRYRVMSFNILDQLDSQTSWEEFTVIRAYQPSILSFTPQAFYFDRVNPRILTLIGENLFPDTEIYLISKTNREANGEPLILKAVELHVTELGEIARLIFDEEDLELGKYDIFAKNPGGLETRLGDFTIALAKPFDVNVSGAFAPMLTLFGQKEHFLDKVFLPLSFSARGSFVPFKLWFGNIGAEFNVNWTFLSSEKDDFKSKANLLLFHVNAFYQYMIIPQKIAVNGRLGVGFAGVFNYHFEFNKGKAGEAMNMACFTYNLGASVQWFFFKQVFFEGGIDFIQVIHSEIPMNFFRLGFFAGYQF